MSASKWSSCLVDKWTDLFACTRIRCRGLWYRQRPQLPLDRFAVAMAGKWTADKWTDLLACSALLTAADAVEDEHVEVVELPGRQRDRPFRVLDGEVWVGFVQWAGPQVGVSGSVA
jgi:hypothetical protein